MDETMSDFDYSYGTGGMQSLLILVEIQCIYEL